MLLDQLGLGPEVKGKSGEIRSLLNLEKLGEHSCQTQEIIRLTMTSRGKTVPSKTVFLNRVLFIG